MKKSLIVSALLGLVHPSELLTLQQNDILFTEINKEILSKADIPKISEAFKENLERHEAGLSQNVDAFKSMDFIVNENGFKIEKHQVITEDGYILAVYRIPGALTQAEGTPTGPPVLLQHGLGTDMMQWVFNRPEVAQAFVLARQGYDVWMGNNRGTRYSLGHTTLDSSKKEYWQFSWEEMGTKDTPAVIDHILKTTGKPNLTYMGHSEGTTQIMAGAALMPEYYKEKLNLCVFMAPPAAMSNNSVTFMRLASYPVNRALIQGVCDTIGLYSFLPYNYLSSGVAAAFCPLFDGKICNLIISMFADEDPSIDYTERYDVYMSNLPSGSGYLNYVHYGQLVNLDEQIFRRFDMGSKKANQEKYGQDSPPDYDLSLLDFPLVSMSGSKDLLADPTDVAWTNQQLNKTIIFKHEYYMGHMSFAVGKDMSWFTIDAMSIVNHYNSKCDKSTLGSKFTIGNERCEQILKEKEMFLY